MDHQEEANAIQDALRNIGDLERLISKAATGRINPREVYQLKRALDALILVKGICDASKLETIRRLGDQLNLCP